MRSFVRGEGLWAKAQKDAVFFLDKYATGGAEEDFQRYLDALLVPVGDNRARLALQKEIPDLDIAKNGLLAGKNHVEDVDGMIVFFLRFQDFYYLKKAIDIWANADQLIEKLQTVGSDIHIAKLTGETNKLIELRHQLLLLNNQLSELEIEFSLVLSEGARWVRETTMTFSIIALVLLLFVVMVITKRIISGIDQTENDLRISENRFKSLYKTDMLGIVDWHGDGRILDANSAFLNMLGYKQQDIDSGKLNWQSMTPAEGYKNDELALKEIATNGFCTPFEKEFFHRDGSRIPVYLGAALLDGEHDKGICFVVDQTERKHNDAQLRLAATVFDASSEGIMVTDCDLVTIKVNKSLCMLTGFSETELIGKKLFLLTSSMMPEGFFSDLLATLSDTGTWQGDIIDINNGGNELTVHLSINAVYDEKQTTTNYVAIFTDISERKAAEDQLRKLAHYDYLTGLANRSLFDDRLRHALQRASRNHKLLAVLFFDLDRFKPINDIYGHETGDMLLQEVALRVRHAIRENDTVGRLGGDEFVVLLEDLPSKRAAGEVAVKIIDAINQVIKIDGVEHHVGCSIGISSYPEDSKEGLGLTRCADIAMYAAKASGRNRYHYFSPVSG